MTSCSCRNIPSTPIFGDCELYDVRRALYPAKSGRNVKKGHEQLQGARRSFVFVAEVPILRYCLLASLVFPLLPPFLYDSATLDGIECVARLAFTECSS